MLQRVHKPSPAFVLSLISLFVALGGTGYAAFALPAHSVGTNQLKNGAVTEAKVKAHSLTGSALNLAQLGTVPLADKANTATSAVTATTATASPIAKVSYVVARVSVPVTTTTPTRGTATCPAGTSVIGGGATVSDELNGAVLENASIGTTGWFADFINVGNGSVTGSVEAICAPAAATG